MPEILEIEMYRRAASPLVGRTISTVDAPDDWYLKQCDSATVSSVLQNATIEGLHRIGKLMIVETSHVRVGLRFGMTGRLVVDDLAVIDELEYSSARLDPAWNRFTAHFESGGSMTMNDPRRLGGVELDPDVTKLGPDAWSVTDAELVALFAKYKVATKALLLNQQRLAGLGNLLVDELLWRCEIDPRKPANEVKPDLVWRLAQTLGPMLDELYERGGSNCGELFPERSPDGRCPRDGTLLSHDTVGGRSTWWCASHQH